MNADGVDLLFSVFNTALFMAVAVVSFRRSHLLSRYPIWRSVLIGVIAGTWWIVWMIVSWVNRDQIKREWAMYRAERAPSAV
ncbi:hypothetical protein GCM10022234_33750 [Aeromicrobium panaciterrae]|uniref:hypothetical protein n=1 Tax=Aeromicrobium panaciterrae TaxID=363861 RepID=UPI0031D3B105